AGLGPALSRYPAERYLDATDDARLDLGGDGVLDVYASAGEPSRGISISFGRVWLPLVGRPPPPVSNDDSRIVAPQDSPRAVDLVSDGTDVWAADAAADSAQLGLLAQLR
ncbi:MAG: hypothetical protein M3069_17165, partial [Chloroflexota bacterium]|nr:hypothetical protein [Chloroflexota bacterium]